MFNRTLQNPAIKGLVPLRLDADGKFLREHLNIAVFPEESAKVVGHEVGHTLSLWDVAKSFNLMCGDPNPNEWTWGDLALCGENVDRWSHLEKWQLDDAINNGATKLEEK